VAWQCCHLGFNGTAILRQVSRSWLLDGFTAVRSHSGLEQSYEVSKPLGILKNEVGGGPLVCVAPIRRLSIIRVNQQTKLPGLVPGVRLGPESVSRGVLPVSRRLVALPKADREN
jgi:hypothetical protein